MEFIETGKNNREVILLLHGGGLSYWNYRDEAELLQDEYHMIMPILDGHQGSDRHFSSIEDNALEIIEFIDGNYEGKVTLMAGLSLGGQILLEILSKRNDICEYAVIESASVIPSKLTEALIKPSMDLSFNLISNRSFARAQFKNLRIREDLFEDYYHDTSSINKEDLIAFTRASLSYTLKKELSFSNTKAHIYVGSREKSMMIRSAGLINEAIPSSTLNILPDLYHGQFSLNRPKQYADTVRRIIENG